jgi:hypothetical protein
VGKILLRTIRPNEGIVLHWESKKLTFLLGGQSGKSSNFQQLNSKVQEARKDGKAFI